ncbi:M28 family peptidase [Gottschalkia acidurici 9a]|uniref:M28 family peptidase n=1 Tax=Gottschalkia acidurici (strain ATCC 7906 / DSM 604 / BCRC 14475 / CIP 104303 / KCTC 5404 / NCIMB 10678 / 9a) TaxID=1128398 RepID=K0AUN6_GOTA9|nr:M28 family peptidase [Gottschalkia acidurici]AFS77593.1 M28 family peptidase [Gottschalkia acidurici 9a]
MKKNLKGIAILLVITYLFTACNNSNTKSKTIEEVNKAYLSKVDVDYSFSFAKSLEEFKTNEKLGYRTSGSDAEIKTGNKIYEEMKKIGLEEVTRDKFNTDKWEFEKAEMMFKDKDGKEHIAVLGGYQTNFDTKGVKEYEIIYAGKGTKNDLEKLDVKDKLVLIDINQNEEWWVNYPTYQAHLKGAAAVITVQEGGYAEIDPKALNAQDICGPAYAPAFSMSKVDSQVLKDAIESGENDSVTVNFDAKSTVTLNQETYNHYGKIIGKDPDSYIILSAHYDSYFSGFQDDNAAIGLMLGVAKGLIDSGYKPEKTIIFNALAAEEWGVSNTRYDWSTGAYNQVFRVHPEWAGKAVANMNFELPAYEHTSADEIRSVYELQKYLEKFTPSVPKIDGVYKDGISVVSPLRTWSDDFSFSIAGIPALRNDFQDSEFMRTHYHSQFDNEDTYNQNALSFHQNLYGLLAIYYDRTAVVPLDFTVRLSELKNSINKDIFDKSQVSSNGLISEIDKATGFAKDINSKVNKINEEYMESLNSGDTKTAKRLYDESRSLNKELLKVFKFAQDNLVKLTWEDEPIFPHQHSQSNIENLILSIESLEKGDIKTAVDDHLYKIDNNWYGYSFDKDVYNYFTNYVLDQPSERLMWGDGRIVDHEDLYDTINSLLQKYDQTNADVSDELKSLKEALERQKQVLKTSVEQESKSVKTIGEMLSKL